MASARFAKRNRCTGELGPEFALSNNRMPATLWVTYPVTPRKKTHRRQLTGMDVHLPAKQTSPNAFASEPELTSRHPWRELCEGLQPC